MSFQGEKRREPQSGSGGPNEIVACTSCGDTSPCTHTANNGCAAEVILSFNGSLKAFLACGIYEKSQKEITNGSCDVTPVLLLQKFISTAQTCSFLFRSRKYIIQYYSLESFPVRLRSLYHSVCCSSLKLQLSVLNDSLYFSVLVDFFFLRESCFDLGQQRR